MKYDLVVFDLDGTVLDTLDDLTAALNRALGLHGFPGLERQAVRPLIGNGVASTVRRAVPTGTSDEACARVLSDFKKDYIDHVNVRTRPFDGITDLLDALNAAGILTAVNSNKVDSAVRALCSAHFGDRLSFVLGERDGIPRKPAPDGMNHILQSLGVARERALYVGDGEADILTAQNAGMDCAWVSWGYRRRSELGALPIPVVIDDVPALRAFILN